MAGMSTEKKTATYTSLPDSERIASCSGVRGGLMAAASPATRPRRVSRRPSPSRSPRPRRRAPTVPANTASPVVRATG